MGLFGPKSLSFPPQVSPCPQEESAENFSLVSDDSQVASKPGRSSIPLELQLLLLLLLL